MNLTHRPRRNRKSAAIRSLVQETFLNPSDFIYPLFIIDGQKQKSEIKTMPGQFRYSIDESYKVCEEALKLGIPGLALFAYIPDNKKNSQATEAHNPEGLLPKSIQAIKKKFPELILFSDVACDPFSSDGHDGILVDGDVENDITVEHLKKMALVHAQAGADYIAPSDMMDGRIGAIRKFLDKNNFSKTGILAYTAKYASAFYGPFRDALDSAPKSGDKKTYQMNPANKKEALRELQLDTMEGADMVMVKPALSYLDIIQSFKQKSNLPVVAYNVSGEYSMVKMAGKMGIGNEVALRNEILTSIKRAGADIIISYHALEMFKP